MIVNGHHVFKTAVALGVIVEVFIDGQATGRLGRSSRLDPADLRAARVGRVRGDETVSGEPVYSDFDVEALTPDGAAFLALVQEANIPVDRNP